MEEQAPRVAVLGVGHLGAAISKRLAERLDVVTWSRSGSSAVGIAHVRTAAEAVRSADVVVLALFDGASCRDVMGSCADDFDSTATVVNVCTVGPDDAESLEAMAGELGVGYLHAPVIGSVPSALQGSLTVLVGAEPTPAAKEVVELLGEVLVLAGTREAASAKLVANGVLGDTLMTLRTALRRADRLGLGRASSLALLQRTAVGGLVTAKQQWLEGDDPGRDKTQFTVDALAKDLGLLSDSASGTHSMAQHVAALRAEDDGIGDRDVASAILAGPAGQYPDARLTVAPEASVEPGVLEPLHSYALGHATGVSANFRAAFLPTAHIEGHRDGELVSWDLVTYCRLFDGPAPDESSRSRSIDHVEVHGTVATARMTLRHGADTFTDMFLLTKTDRGWRIANKVYARD